MGSVTVFRLLSSQDLRHPDAIVLGECNGAIELSNTTRVKDGNELNRSKDPENLKRSRRWIPVVVFTSHGVATRPTPKA
jgi:hypothetical protein